MGLIFGRALSNSGKYKHSPSGNSRDLHVSHKRTVFPPKVLPHYTDTICFKEDRFNAAFSKGPESMYL